MMLGSFEAADDQAAVQALKGADLAIGTQQLLHELLVILFNFGTYHEQLFRQEPVVPLLEA